MFVVCYRPGRITPLLGRFSDLPQLLSDPNISNGSLDVALMDVGSSSMQFDQSERGFMLSQDGPLDMRMDGNRYEFLALLAKGQNELMRWAVLHLSVIPSVVS